MGSAGTSGGGALSWLGPQRKPVDGTPGGGSSAAGALIRLGPGQSLPGMLQSRLERAIGGPLGDVRVHTDARAAALADDERAHALTIGPHIAFAAGAWRPGTPFGEALLAHEAAHVAQQRAGAAGVGAEAAADAVAAGFLAAGRAGRAAPAAACDCSAAGTPAAEFDWRGAARTEVTDAVARIRQLQAELDTIVAGEPTPASQRRLDQIQQELATQVQRLRAAGIRMDLISLLQGIQAGEDLLHVTGRIVGADPNQLYFGERRLLRLALDWVPQHTDVRTAWISQLDAPVEMPEPPTANPGTAFEKPLNDVFWGQYEVGARRNLAFRGARLPRVKVWVYVFVGSRATPEARIATPWLEIVDQAPAVTTIDSPRILAGDPQQLLSPGGPAPGPAPETGSGAAPVTAPVPAAGAAPQAVGTAALGQSLVLQDAVIPFMLSWVPPIGWSTGQGYRVTWTVSGGDQTLSRADLEELARQGGHLPQSQQTVFEYRFGTAGDHVVYAVLQPGTTEVTEPFTEGPGNHLPTRTLVAWLRPRGEPLVAARRVHVVDVTAMAAEQLVRTARQPARSFATFMSDLNQQITTTTEAIEGGTLAPRELGAQKERLVEQRSAIEGKLGQADAMLPFPQQDNDFRRDALYVTPLPSAYAHPDIGGAQPLATFARVRWADTAWEAVLVDATTSEVLPRQGTGDSPRAALLGALADWAAPATTSRPAAGWRTGSTGGASTTASARQQPGRRYASGRRLS